MTDAEKANILYNKFYDTLEKSNITRQSTSISKGEDKEYKKITLFINTHGAEYIKSPLQKSENMEIRIFSFINEIDVCNYTSYRQSNIVLSMLKDAFMNKIDKSSYETIRTVFEEDIRPLVYAKTYISKEDKRVVKDENWKKFKNEVDTFKNIKTYKPIHDKSYGIKNEKEHSRRDITVITSDTKKTYFKDKNILNLSDLASYILTYLDDEHALRDEFVGNKIRKIHMDIIRFLGYKNIHSYNEEKFKEFKHELKKWQQYAKAVKLNDELRLQGDQQIIKHFKLFKELGGKLLRIHLSTLLALFELEGFDIINIVDGSCRSVKNVSITEEEKKTITEKEHDIVVNVNKRSGTKKKKKKKSQKKKSRKKNKSFKKQK